MRLIRSISLAALLALSVDSASAQRTRDSSVTTSGGKTASSTSTRNKGQVQSSVTGPNS